jgi:folylpolyglutamate synthase/dihydropteroate synthase
MDIQRLESEFANCGIMVRTADSVSKSLELAMSQALNSDLICVTGSLFTVGDAIGCLTSD